MDDNSLDDVLLLEQILGARVEALNELYDHYSRLVYSIAFNVVGEGRSAEEITMDVFMRVWEKADTYRADRGSVRAWLGGMTRNRAIDLLRRDRTRFNVRRRIWAEHPSSPITNERQPESAAGLRMSKERLRAAIKQLSAEQRDVLALAYFQGYTQSEIAQLLDLPLGTVKTRIRSGVQKLRLLLKDEHSS